MLNCDVRLKSQLLLWAFLKFCYEFTRFWSCHHHHISRHVCPKMVSISLLYLGVHPSKNISKVFYFGGSCLIATRSAVSGPLWKSLLTEVLKMRQNKISSHHDIKLYTSLFSNSIWEQDTLLYVSTTLCF